MLPFFYFTDTEKNSVTRETIERLNLDYAFPEEDGSPSVRQVDPLGPSGRPGVVFCNARQLGNGNVGYWPDKQEWMEVPTEEGAEPSGVWIGFNKEEMPTSKVLARRVGLPGVKVPLGGQDWVIPYVRKYIAATETYSIALPLDYKRTLDGWFSTGVSRKYKDIYETSARIFDSYFSIQLDEEGNPKDEPDIDDNETIDTVCRLVGLNYTIDIWEASLLGFADGESNPFDALSTAFDLKFYSDETEESKKKAETELASSGENSLLGAKD